jgi:hypothetical protein
MMSFAPSQLLRLAPAFALSMSVAACNDQACIEKSAARGGTCPSRLEAISLIGNGCQFISGSQRIESVDSDAEENGNLCCYDVSYETSGNITCTPTKAPPPHP